MRKIRILMADDHQLFRKGLINIINQNEDLEVVGEANDGNDFFRLIDKGLVADLFLLDVNMPNLDGIETVIRLNRRGIKTPVLMLSMEDDEATIIQLMKLGSRGYILKDASPDELMQSIRMAASNKYFINDILSSKVLNSIEEKSNGNGQHIIESLSDRELEFLKLTSTELTYKEMADKMSVSPRTIDFYRDSLFTKLNVKSRVGLAMYAIKKGLVTI
jgi:DNA-binding NarL/FixJ family response regulator